MTGGSILLVRAKQLVSAAESSRSGVLAIRDTPLTGAQLSGFGKARRVRMAGHFMRH
jgi:hypothetical protein